MNSDYYDYTPTVTLPRSLAVAGSPDKPLQGGGVRARCAEWAVIERPQPLDRARGRPVDAGDHPDRGRLLTGMWSLRQRCCPASSMTSDTVLPSWVRILWTANPTSKLSVAAPPLVYLSHSESIVHSAPLQMAEVVVDMKRKSVSEAVQILHDALPRLARLNRGLVRCSTCGSKED